MINPNDPAFGIVRATNFEPIEGKPNAFRAVRWDVSSGLTKREWYAGQAMVGINILDAMINNKIHTGKVEELARSCVAFADALIAELTTPQEGQEK